MVLDHVHWDREWYRPHEQFRSRLLELVVTVVEELERGDRPVFHLDGQTVTVADVLAIRPGLEPRLSALVRDGRLTIGPWHVLADNQLVSGECLVRNLLIARRWGRRLGGLAREGYSPDAFGHPGDLPRILRGFDISTAVVWRGAPPEHARFRWRSPDGSEVFAVHQRYHEAEVLWDESTAGDAVREFVAQEGARCPDGPLLLMNGGDHLLPRRLRDRTAAFASAGVDAVPVSLPEFFAAAGVATGDLPVVDGELRHLGDRLSFLLPGTLSARTYLKAANVRAQAFLADWAEPLGVLSPSVDGPELLAHAWELAVKNAPHDSVCGCSVDAVHEENMVRAATVLQIGEDLRSRAFQRLGLETRRRGPAATHEAHVAVVNPHARKVTQGVTVDVLTAPGRRPVAAFTQDGTELAVDIEDLGVEKAFEADLDLMPDTVDVRRHRLSFVAADVAAHGVEIVRVDLSDLPPAPAPGSDTVGRSGGAADPPDWTPGRQLRMGDLTVDVAPDATVTVTSGGFVLPGIGRLVDEGDRGDTYTWDPVAGDEPVHAVLRSTHTRTGRARGELRIRADLDLPVALTPDRAARSTDTVTVPVEILVTAWRGVPGISCTVSWDNVTRDHRLRWHLPAAGPVTAWTADGLYSLVTRPVGPVIGDLPTDAGFEAEIGVAPVQGVAALGEGDHRVAVLCAGLPEVQGLDTGELAVTLLRGVGWLSRFDVTARTAGAGPQLATPGAQCPGPQSFTLGLRWGGDVADDLDLVAAGAEHRSPLTALQVYASARGLPEAPDILAVSGAIVTAWKRAEDGEGSVLRLCNPTATTRRVEVTGTFLASVRDVELSEFDERRGAPSPVRPAGADPDGSPVGTGAASGFSLELPPYAVRTLRLLP